MKTGVVFSKKYYVNMKIKLTDKIESSEIILHENALEGFLNTQRRKTPGKKNIQNYNRTKFEFVKGSS